MQVKIINNIVLLRAQDFDKILAQLSREFILDEVVEKQDRDSYKKMRKEIIIWQFRINESEELRNSDGSL